jgi:hypothetical protein
MSPGRPHPRRIADDFLRYHVDDLLSPVFAAEAPDTLLGRRAGRDGVRAVAAVPGAGGRPTYFLKARLKAASDS